MVPAAAVIPSPILYIKCFAFKKLVDGPLVVVIGPTLCVGTIIVYRHG